MKKFIIADHTSNTGKEYIADDHSNTGDETSAMVFETEAEAEKYIRDSNWSSWAYVIEMEL